MTSTVHGWRVAAAGGLACLAVLGAGCSSSHSPSAGPVVTVTAPTPAKSSSSSSSPASAPTVTVTATPAPQPTTGLPIPAGLTLCATHDLKIYLGLGQGAMGSTYQNIDFQNIGSSTCVLYGYPGVSLAGGSPVSQIGPAAEEDPSTPRQVVILAPGDTGNALLRLTHTGVFPPSPCNPTAAAYLQIYPPNQTTPAYIAYTATTCSGPVHTLLIQATRPGAA